MIEVQAVGAGQWVAPSRSNPGQLHVIREVRGDYSCTCLGNVHRGHCAHVDAVTATIAKPAFNLAPGMALLTGKSL